MSVSLHPDGRADTLRGALMARLVPAALLCAALFTALPLAAKTLRFASAFDPQTMDPHSIALLYHSRVNTQLYEALVNRSRDFALEPSLALSWQAVDPKTWRFKLRPNVRFHEVRR